MKKWTATKVQNGNIIFVDEQNTSWIEAQKNMTSLTLHNNSQIITLPQNMEKYIQGKSASANLGSGAVNIESRYVGFIFENVMVKLRVDEVTNNINIEVEKVEKDKR